jgi:hypothetical protein
MATENSSDLTFVCCIGLAIGAIVGLPGLVVLGLLGGAVIYKEEIVDHSKYGLEQLKAKYTQLTTTQKQKKLF